MDDTTGEVLGYVMDKLLEAGALDVFFTPIYMKKCRPAVKLTFLAKECDVNKLEKILFSETSTIGIRKIEIKRSVMERNIHKINTKYGEISIKKAVYEDITKYSGEFEDMKKAAIKYNIPIKTIYDEITKLEL
jgi:uncharacterized protein (DUF111 family)